MIFRNLFFQIIVRVFLIVVNSLAIAFFGMLNRDYLTTINLIILLIIQSYLLVRFLNKFNEDIARFFIRIQADDSSFVKPLKMNKNYQKLWDSFERVNHVFREVKSRIEKQNIFLQTVTEHIPTGLIAINSDNKIEIFNKSAQQLIGCLIDKQTLEISDDIYDELVNLSPSHPKLIKHFKNDQVQILSCKAILLKQDKKVIKLISLQNIRNELDDKEMDSWQKLVKVLNHEIMNSIAPIISTIKVLDQYIINEEQSINSDQKNNANRILKKTKDGLSIIRERSEWLEEFVKKYQHFTSLPKPKIESFNLFEYLKSIELFMHEDLAKSNLNFTINIDRNISINADKSLFERVVVNLISNSIFADSKNLIVSMNSDEEYNNILLSDDGNGIPAEISDKIFIPFFTTREGGSGIGLSLSKQIMKLHKGDILLQEKPKRGCGFILRFNYN